MNTVFNKYSSKLLHDRKALSTLIGEATAKAEKQQSRIGGFWKDLKSLIRLVRAWMKGEYRQIPWKSLTAAVGAIFYFVNPLDVIPDLLIAGFLDDAVVIGWALNYVKADLKKFLAWEQGSGLEAGQGSNHNKEKTS